MIQMKSKLVVADNSGAKLAKCIRVVGKSSQRVSGIGEVVVANVISAIPGSKVKKGQIVKGVLVRTKKEILRADGSTIKFDDNAIVLVGKDNEPIATRVFGPVARELRSKNFIKILSLALEVL